MLHEATITVRYHPGKADEKKLPAKVTFIGTHLDERSNGEPKAVVNGMGKADLMEDFDELIERDGVAAVADRYNHGTDLRTRAGVRPADGVDGPSKTARRQATVSWAMRKGDEMARGAVTEALALHPKACNQVLDAVYKKYENEINN